MVNNVVNRGRIFVEAWEEFARLNTADEPAVREFCRKWNLYHYNENSGRVRWRPYLDAEAEELKQPALHEISNYHGYFLDAVAYLEQFTAAVRRNDHTGAQSSAAMIQLGADTFLMRNSPRVQLSIKDNLPVLMLRVVPDAWHSVVDGAPPEEATTFGTIYHELLRHVLQEQPVLRCDYCGHHFVATERQASAALRRKRTYCQTCKNRTADPTSSDYISEYRLRGRRGYHREDMRKRRAPKTVARQEEKGRRMHK